jgi:hypothetical protein
MQEKFRPSCPNFNFRSGNLREELTETTKHHKARSLIAGA